MCGTHLTPLLRGTTNSGNGSSEFEALYRAAVWAAEVPGNRSSILDIGSGTGLLSELLLKRYPTASLTLLDMAPSMLEVARRRLEGRENVQYLLRDYSREGIDEGYDIICSALSIHHLARQRKRALYRKVYSALTPGGVFVNADQVEGESPWTHQRYLEYWDSFVKNGPIEPQEAEAILARRDQLDKMEKLSLQLKWLRESGFADVDVVYKNRSFAVLFRRRT